MKETVVGRAYPAGVAKNETTQRVSSKVKLLNGPKTKLMDELYALLLERYDAPDEAILSLYLARACAILEQRGWKRG